MSHERLVLNVVCDVDADDVNAVNDCRLEVKVSNGMDGDGWEYGLSNGKITTTLDGVKNCVSYLGTIST